jgi:hypothetical protein
LLTFPSTRFSRRSFEILKIQKSRPAMRPT